MGAYSFLDVQAAIEGPGGAFQLGSGSGNAEEGITIEPGGDKNVMQIGADGGHVQGFSKRRNACLTMRSSSE